MSLVQNIVSDTSTFFDIFLFIFYDRVVDSFQVITHYKNKAMVIGIAIILRMDIRGNKLSMIELYTL